VHEYGGRRWLREGVCVCVCKQRRSGWCGVMKGLGLVGIAAVLGNDVGAVR
jgi:hypothetical protein